MNITSTNYSKSPLQMRIFQMLFLLTFTFAFYSCAATAQDNSQKDSDSTEASVDQGEKTFTFHRMSNGKDNLWKAVFKDGKLVDLYKNGSKIPQENIDDYQDMVDDEIAGVEFHEHGFPMRPFHFKFDRKALDSSMAALKLSLSHKDFGWVDSAFDSEEFRQSMDSLRTNLKGLKKMKFDFHFDTAGFNHGMRELKENLSHMKFNKHDFECNMGAFRKDMRKFRDEMRHNSFNSEDFKIDMHKFDHEMEKLGEELKHLDLKMNDLHKEMEKLHAFMKDMRHELVKDKLIKSEDEDFDMKFNSKELIINGKKVPDSLLEKYKKIYKQHFGKDIDDGMRINMN